MSVYRENMHLNMFLGSLLNFTHTHAYTLFWKTLKTKKKRNNNMKILDSEMSAIATLKDLLSRYIADSDDADCSTLPSRGQRSCERGDCRLYALTQ